jgi:hypothetical protein
MKQNLNKPENLKYKKYFHFASDATNVKSVPELALYPLANRSPKNVIVKSDDTLENNYKILKTFNRNDKKSIMTFMENHTKYDEDTYFYVYKT